MVPNSLLDSLSGYQRRFESSRCQRKYDMSLGELYEDVVNSPAPRLDLGEAC